MPKDIIPRFLEAVDPARLKRMLFHLAKAPLPYRKLNYTRPGASKNSLYEADDYIRRKLRAWGYPVEKEGVQVQAFARDATKPKAHQYAVPPEDAPWYTAYNLYAKKKGARYPRDIILLLAHKDSQSWVDSPGAYDNAVGTVALLEIARVLKDYRARRSISFLFCNEEHRPWTSRTAARNCRERGDNLIAIFNIDSIGGKSQEEIDAGKKPNVTCYTEPEAERLANLMAEVNDVYGIGLAQQTARHDKPCNDDGSFVKEGYKMAVHNVGSSGPYRDPNYHTEDDRPESVDIDNVRMATQATLAAVLRIDRDGL